jgi:hypothetical protein
MSATLHHAFKIGVLLLANSALAGDQDVNVAIREFVIHPSGTRVSGLAPSLKELKIFTDSLPGKVELREIKSVAYCGRPTTDFELYVVGRHLERPETFSSIREACEALFSSKPARLPASAPRKE